MKMPHHRSSRLPLSMLLTTALGARGAAILNLFGLLMLGAASPASAEDSHYYRDLFADTWVGHDALGRNMPTCSVVGPVKTDHRRVVGIFYITWHSDANHRSKSP